MELWRAVRLVVDTGIHDKKWTREEGIDFYVNNTPNAKADAVKMVERHIVMPSQATAYKIGMNKILELREKRNQSLATSLIFVNSMMLCWVVVRCHLMFLSSSLTTILVKRKLLSSSI